jgi:hypothetical protein
MNGALLLSNAIALATVMSFHFCPTSQPEPVAQRIPHYLQLQNAPQLTVMSDQRVFVSPDSSAIPTRLSERLVF